MGKGPMNTEVFVTCAVTGAGDTVGKHPAIPVTPRQIADAAIEAAKAGAAIAHIHVRDPETGKAARDPKLYAQVVEFVRESGVDVVLNLTAGMGGDVVFGQGETPLPLDPAGTDMVGPLERLAHVEALLPEICTLDCGTMNFSAGDYVMTNTPSMLRGDGGEGAGVGRATGARSLRHRPSRLRKAADQGKAARRSDHDPALHGHPLRCARRSADPDGDGAPAAARRDL